MYLDKRSGHFSAVFMVTKLDILMRCRDIFSSYSWWLSRIFLTRPRDVSSYVCADVTLYFRPKHDIFFTLTKCKPNQTIITGHISWTRGRKRLYDLIKHITSPLIVAAFEGSLDHFKEIRVVLTALLSDCGLCLYNMKTWQFEYFVQTATVTPC